MVEGVSTKPKVAQWTKVNINLGATMMATTDHARDDVSRNTAVMVDVANPEAVEAARKVAVEIVNAFFKGMVPLQ